MAERRPYRRESEERRRDDLIAAALDLVAEGGIPGATVRAIADRAGVTPGLIRHYFSSKEDLTRVAYHRLMERMNSDSAAVLQGGPEDATARLANFVVASVSAPVADPVAVGLVVPGVVDEVSGVGVFASNMGWRDAPIRALAEEAFGLPVVAP